MKFGKMIQKLGRELPDKLFLRYKDLKKLLKLVKKVQGNQDTDLATGGCETSVTINEEVPQKVQRDVLSAEETKFIKELNKELSSLNNFFIDAEEKVVIRLQALEAQLNQMQEAKNEDDIQTLKAAFIDFHGEIVLLLHWGLLNYAAVTKILKKHDKHTGLPLKAPYLEAVLKQPFYSTDLLGKLAKRVADIVEQLVDPNDHAPKYANSATRADIETQSATVRDKVRMTQMALGTWQELGNNASTPSTVLPTKLIENMEGTCARDEEQLSSSNIGHASPKEVPVSKPSNIAQTCGNKRSADILGKDDHEPDCESHVKRQR